MKNKMMVLILLAGLFAGNGVRVHAEEAASKAPVQEVKKEAGSKASKSEVAEKAAGTESEGDCKDCKKCKTKKKCKKCGMKHKGKCDHEAKGEEHSDHHEGHEAHQGQEEAPAPAKK